MENYFRYSHGALPGNANLLTFSLRIALAVIFFLIHYRYIATGDIVRWSHQFFMDDSFYYVKVADNFAKHGWFTFDEINQTNGFQPLWMAILLGLRTLSGHEAFVQSVLVFCIGLYAAASVLFGLVVENTTRSRTAGICAQILFATNWLLFRSSAFMMENAIAFPLILLILLRMQSGSLTFLNDRTRDNIINGGLLAALALTRIDYLIFLPILGFFFIFKIRGRICTGGFFNQVISSLRERCRFFVFLAPTLSFVTLMACNKIFFGSPSLISGMVKRKVSKDYLSAATDSVDVWHIYARSLTSAASIVLASAYDFIRPLLHVDFLGEWRVWATSAVICLAVFVVRKEKGPGKLEGWSIILFSAVALLHMALMVFYIPIFADAPWYYTLESLALAIASFSALSLIIHRYLHPAVYGVLVPAAFMSAIYFIERVDHETKAAQPANSLSAAFIQVAERLKFTTAENTIIAGSNVGMIGYFSSRRVINLDGLVNSIEYYNDVLLSWGTGSPAMADYLKKKNVSILSDMIFCGKCEDEDVVTSAIRAYELPGNTKMTVVAKVLTDNPGWAVFAAHLSLPAEDDADSSKAP